MFHVTVFLHPRAVSMGLLDGPAVKCEPFDLATPAIDEAIGLAWAICNSYPDEMFCDAEYRPIVEQYRAACHRSLSNGDYLMLQDGDVSRLYKLGDGFASSEPILITDRLAEGFVNMKDQGIIHDPAAARLLQAIAELDRQIIADCLEGQ